MSGDNYDDGRRDTAIEQLKESDSKQWDSIRSLEAWQNKGLGYLAVLVTIMSLLAPYLLKKWGV